MSSPFHQRAVTDSITVPLNLSRQRIQVPTWAQQWSRWTTGLASSTNIRGFLKRTWTSRTTLRPISSILPLLQPSRSAVDRRSQAPPLRPGRLWPRLHARARVLPRRKAQGVAPASARPRNPSPRSPRSPRDLRSLRSTSLRKMSMKTPRRLSAAVPVARRERLSARGSPPRPRTSPRAVGPSPLL